MWTTQNKPEAQFGLPGPLGVKKTWVGSAKQGNPYKNYHFDQLSLTEM